MGKGGMVHLMSPATAAATAINGFVTNSELFKA
jgi:3-isopropylmalate/(R)-2-methylmalate dehydratase large subunit